MSGELVFHALVVVGMLLFALSLRAVERILRRHDERLRLNTRRIWKLEGSPRSEASEDLE